MGNKQERKIYWSELFEVSRKRIVNLFVSEYFLLGSGLIIIGSLIMPNPALARELAREVMENVKTKTVEVGVSNPITEAVKQSSKDLFNQKRLNGEIPKRLSNFPIIKKMLIVQLGVNALNSKTIDSFLPKELPVSLANYVMSRELPFQAISSPRILERFNFGYNYGNGRLMALALVSFLTSRIVVLSQGLLLRGGQSNSSGSETNTHTLQKKLNVSNYVKYIVILVLFTLMLYILIQKQLIQKLSQTVTDLTENVSTTIEMCNQEMASNTSVYNLEYNLLAGKLDFYRKLSKVSMDILEGVLELERDVGESDTERLRFLLKQFISSIYEVKHFRKVRLRELLQEEKQARGSDIK